MKRLSLVIAMTLLWTSLVWSQTSAQTDANVNDQASATAGKNNVTSGVSSSSSVSAKSGNGNHELVAGTTFNAALVTAVDSKRTKPGDEVTARTTENVRSEGKTVLPKGTKLIGRVTRSSARAKGDTESSVGIAFDRAILKSGQEIPLNLVIQALASSQAAASAGTGDMDMMADAGASMNASGAGRSRGVLGAAGSTVGSTAGTATNTAGQVGATGDAALNSSLHSAAGLVGSSPTIGGLNASGQLSSNSRGVFNLNGLSLNSSVDGQTQASVITSAGKSVHLDSGTRMLLVTGAAASTTPN
jgi:hypothetical protein